MPLLARFAFHCSLILMVLSGGANAAEQRSKCRYQPIAQLPLQYHGQSMNLTMDGEINGTPAVMLIDTGASHTWLTRYWDHAAVEVPLLFEFDHTRPFIEVELNGVKMRALLDTGATGSSVSASAAKRAGVGVDSPGVTARGESVGAGKKRVRLYRATFKTFSIAEESISNACPDNSDGGIPLAAMARPDHAILPRQADAGAAVQGGAQR